MKTGTEINLSGVPETMLWTLYNRANEAKRPAGLLVDPACVRVYEAISYDYRSSFGKPDGSHALRSRIFDEALRPWLAAHPGGTVVELGAGLETQFQRCDNGAVNWVCVDVPEAIDARERFFAPSERCRHLRRSALDLSWIDEADGSRGVFVTAQGLFMYFEEAEVRRLVTTVAERLPGVTLMFDVIPPWFAKKTMSAKGFARTKTYTAPRMPWGIARDDVVPTLRSWTDRIVDVQTETYGYARGPMGIVTKVFGRLPKLRNVPPAIVRVQTRS
ncbi:MAG: class I SAM-dependent methyltransferase [Polyangiales bacterium]